MLMGVGVDSCGGRQVGREKTRRLALSQGLGEGEAEFTLTRFLDSPSGVISTLPILSLPPAVVSAAFHVL